MPQADVHARGVSYAKMTSAELQKEERRLSAAVSSLSERLAEAQKAAANPSIPVRKAELQGHINKIWEKFNEDFNKEVEAYDAAIQHIFSAEKQFGMMFW
jgi:hypothetical protein